MHWHDNISAIAHLCQWHQMASYLCHMIAISVTDITRTDSDQ